ncbi:MAG: glycosyltransferase family 2 protein [Muribaculaceae bacterium]|nr:glycosyltransferase family 2 protein [Muribaculaceae bacterium]
MPEVSFIIPAYNAACFIADAIRAVIAQTLTDWELIIVDDNSQDNTLEIARKFADADPRIRVFHRSVGSGGACIPRYDALRHARSPLILPLDADDVILPDYAATLMTILKERCKGTKSSVYPHSVAADNINSESGTQADPYTAIIYPAEYLWTPPFESSRAFRPDYFDPRSEIICHPGSQAVILTLDGWKVPAAGGLIPRRIYLEAYHRYGIDHENFIYADEILTRYLMCEAEEVIFSDKAIYYCRTHPASITTLPTLRRLDILKASAQLIDFAEKRFGRDSEEFHLAHRQLFNWIFQMLELLSHPAFSRADRRKGYRIIGTYRRQVNIPLIRRITSRKFMAAFPLPLPIIRRLMQLRRRLKPTDK